MNLRLYLRWIIHPCLSEMNYSSLFIWDELFILVHLRWIIHPCLSEMNLLSLFIWDEFFILVYLPENWLLLVKDSSAQFQKRHLRKLKENNTFLKLKNDNFFFIVTQIRVYKVLCESDMSLYKWRVTWNYVSSPFNRRKMNIYRRQSSYFFKYSFIKTVVFKTDRFSFKNTIVFR